MSHRVHCSRKLSPLQHGNEPTSASCAPACVLFLQHVSMRTPGGACPCFTSPQYVSLCVPTLDPVYNTPQKFENAALFLRLGLPSTLIRHENGAFRKCSSNRRNLETPALRFSVDGKTFLKRSFLKKMMSR